MIGETMVTDISLASASLNSTIERQKHDVLSYHANWFELISQLYGYTFIPLTTSNTRGEITGFLPLCYMQSPLTGKRLVSLPFSDICPLLATDETDVHALIDQATALAKERRV